VTAADVIEGRAKWSAECADCLTWLRALLDDSVDLLFTSPFYEDSRTYGLGKRLPRGQEWVDFMVAVVTAAAPKVKGLIAINCEGQTRGYRYSCVPFLLMADLHRAGFNLRKPPVFHRVGIPGSGGPDWLRNDYEPIVCITRKGKLPWSDNTAMGHIPKWAPGGEMSYRQSNGTRRNQWGHSPGLKTGPRSKNGERGKTGRPSHVTGTVGEGPKRFRHDENGNVKGAHERDVCAIANPGNVVKVDVGGGVMGHPLAHESEAPFPLELPAFFVKSFCPPDGIVADCFAGSFTTIHAAIDCGRRGIGCDIRQSMIGLGQRRMSTVTSALFAS
jgi:hypothetical protein